MLEHHRGLRRALSNGLGVSDRVGLVRLVLRLPGNALTRQLNSLLLHWYGGLLLQRWPRYGLLLGDKLRSEGALTHFFALFVFHF